MTLVPGTRLGVYEVTGALGAGGMGEVYRARDTKLKRDVALKLLPDHLAADPDRLARFTREAQTLAALSHPNIAAIYGLEESEGVRALVMELVEGDDLSVHIARGPMPLDEVRPVARQIADALEAAHELGIIHRDLKPANVKVRPDGTVKVLDFGIAKVLDAGSEPRGEVTSSPTITARATQLGMILGTAAYMAPEQARGKPVDRRADIWAFGAILFEMLTARRPFEGEDVSIMLASVLKDEVPWGALPPDLPAPIRRLLRRCLEKDPRRRLSAIGDARLELEEKESPAVAMAASPAKPAARSIGLPIVAALVALAVLATTGVMRWRRPVSSAPGGAGGKGLYRLTVMLPEGDVLGDRARLPLSLSPDGRYLAYVARHQGRRQLQIRDLAETESSSLPGTEGALMPFFSPDSRWVGFFAEGKLKKIAVGGAGLQVVCDNPGDARGGAWGEDGNVYFAPTNNSGIWKVPATGGTPVEVTRVDPAKGEISHRWPQFIEDGPWLLFSIWTGPGTEERQVALQSLATGERRIVMMGGATPRYFGKGWLVYARLDNLFALPWRLPEAIGGSEVPLSLAERARNENEGAASYALSSAGTLAYVPGGSERHLHRAVWLERGGAIEPIPLPERAYESIALSPDGARAVVQVSEGSLGLWIYDFARRTLTPFQTSGGSSQAPVWTPDVRRILYRGTRNGRRNVWWKASDGTGQEERLTSGEGVVETPMSVSPDGRWLVFSQAGGASRLENTLWKLPLDGDRIPQPLVANTQAMAGRVSPDGRWLAYASTLSGESEIYVQPFPDPGPAKQVSNGGGAEPLWSGDGRELFYLDADALMAVDFHAPGPAVGQPRVLAEGRFRFGPNANTGYGVSPDGRRFLRIQPSRPDPPQDRIEVVLGWADELRRLSAK